jgi:hypothetical protein
MYARVTMLEIDPLRIDMDDAVALYARDVVPVLCQQRGYEGAYVLTTPEGRALLLTFWDTEEEADAHAPVGFYSETLAQFATLFQSPPGREHYLVAFEDAPAKIAS